MAQFMESYTFEIPGYEPIQWATDYAVHDATHPDDQELYIRGAATAKGECKREETGSIAGWRCLDHVKHEQHTLGALDCHRCSRSFVNSFALQQHLENSPSHWKCPICDFDSSDRRFLIAHWRYQGCLRVCEGCHLGQGGGIPHEMFEQHLVNEHVCPECHQHFLNENNLEQHMLTHLSPMIPCIGHGCPRTFRTFPGMIIHLESGTCSSGTNIKSLNKSAAYVYQWKKLLASAYRDQFIQGEDFAPSNQDGDRVEPFLCPGCPRQFTKLSGLFQHVGSLACSENWDDGAVERLVHWLHLRHYHRIRKRPHY